MTPNLPSIPLLLLGAGLAAALLFSFWWGRRWHWQWLLARERLEQLQARQDELLAERQQQQQKLEQQQLLLLKLNTRLKEYETLLRAERQAQADKLELQQAAEARLGEQFENLAHRLLDQTSSSFRDLNQQHLDLLLSPLKSQLEGFRRQLGETHAEETRQRHILVITSYSIHYTKLYDPVAQAWLAISP